MNELQAKLEPLLKELIAEVWAVAKDDVDAYGTDIAADFARYLYRYHLTADDVAAENLKDLQAQVKLLAVKHRIVLQRGAMEKLSKALGIVAQIALATLKSL